MRQTERVAQFVRTDARQRFVNPAGHFMQRPAFGHTGFTGTSLWIAPQHDLYVILLTARVNPTRNNSRIGPVRVAVADAAMRALKPEVVAAIEARSGAASPPPTGRP